MKQALTVHRLLAMAGALLLLAACATDPAAIRPTIDSTAPRIEEPAPAAAAQPLPAVTAMAISEDAGTCRLALTCTTPPRYTVFALSDPDRLIVDLDDTRPGTIPASQTIDSDYLTMISHESLEDDAGALLRFTFALTGKTPYRAASEGNVLLIDLGTPQTGDADASQSPAAALPPTTPPAVYGITADHRADTTRVYVHADRPLTSYSVFPMHNPPRLVVDLKDTRAGSPRFAPLRPTALVSRVRTAPRGTDLRLVLDLADGTMPDYTVTPVSNRLVIALAPPAPQPSAEPEPADAPVDTTPAAAEPAPVAGQQTSDKPAAARISLDFKDADLKNVLRLLADVSGTNMIVNEAISGRVTLKLENLPWNEALDIILDTHGLGKIETDTITRIETRDQIKRINEEKLLAKKSQEEIEDLVVKTFDISYAKAGDMAKFLQRMKILSDRGSITEFKLTNKLTVQDIAENVTKVEALIREHDIPTRQVMIEARIVQSNPTYVKELGIRWGGTYTTTHNGDDVNVGGAAGDDYIVNLPAAAGEGSGGAINFGYITDKLNLDVQLSALETDDKIKIISNPRVLALDNKEARIKQGVALPYMTLNENGVTSSEFKDAVLEMVVTPKITPANTIALHLFVTKNQKSSQTGGDGEPGIDVREVETDLLVKSGITVVIGGIYETEEVKNISSVPFFGTLPYIGRAFRNDYTEERLTELLVFLTVTVVERPELYATGASQQG